MSRDRLRTLGVVNDEEEDPMQESFEVAAEEDGQAHFFQVSIQKQHNSRITIWRIAIQIRMT